MFTLHKLAFVEFPFGSLLILSSCKKRVRYIIYKVIHLQMKNLSVLSLTSPQHRLPKKAHYKNLEIPATSKTYVDQSHCRSESGIKSLKSD